MAALAWSLYALVLLALGRAIWLQAAESDRAQERLEEFRRREQERHKPPRRFVSGPGNYREEDP